MHLNTTYSDKQGSEIHTPEFIFIPTLEYAKKRKRPSLRDQFELEVPGQYRGSRLGTHPDDPTTTMTHGCAPNILQRKEVNHNFGNHAKIILHILQGVADHVLR